MKNVLATFNGSKTYIVAAATVLYAAIAWWSGQLDQTAAMAMIFGGAGLGALRHGVATTLIDATQKMLPILLDLVRAELAQNAAPTDAGAKKGN